MAGRNEGCAGIGCAGICFLFLVAVCTGPGSGGRSVGGHPGYSPDTAITSAPAEPREWFYIHGTMNVRTEPHPDAEILRTLGRGDMVQLGPRDANGWARLYLGNLPDGYIYRASDLVRTTAPAAPQPVRGDGGSRRSSGGRQLHVGSRGGCYYINSNGNKTYVDRSECSGGSASAAPEPLITTGSGSSGGGSRRSGGGRQLHVGPRGGCYYINGNGNKTYVDRSECY